MRIDERRAYAEVVILALLCSGCLATRPARHDSPAGRPPHPMTPPSRGSSAGAGMPDGAEACEEVGKIGGCDEALRAGAGHETGEARLPPSPHWFLKQRLTGDGEIPLRARSVALESDSARRIAQGRQSAPGAWVPEGPTNIGGRITALAVDPNDTKHLWAGSAAGGVWESPDRGATWSAVFDGLPAQSIGSIATHPTNSSIVYVGTGEDDGAGYSYDGEGVFRTTDGGQTWSPLGLAETRRIGRIAIDPANPDRVFVAAGGSVFNRDGFRGVYRSTDAGASWSQVLFVADDAGAVDVAIDPSNPLTVYAAIWERINENGVWTSGGVNSGIYRSTDGGDTWTLQTSGLPAAGPTIGRIGLAIAPSSPNIVYAIYRDDPGFFMGVYKTTDSGATWTRIDNPNGSHIFFFSSDGYYFGQIRVKPTNPDVVYLLDVNWYRSVDGGVNYTRYTAGIHRDHHDLTVGGPSLVMATDGGVYTSPDDGATWSMGSGLAVTQFYDLGMDQQDPLRRFGGTQDNGTVRTQTGGQSDWVDMLGGDGFHTEVDPTDSTKVYAEQQYGFLFKSTDGGATFTYARMGINHSEPKNWSTPFVHDPLTSGVLYTGTNHVYRSVNAGVSWTVISGDLTNGPIVQPGGGTGEEHGDPPQDHLVSNVTGTVTTIGVSRADTGIVWAGTDDGNVWVTPDDGVSWTQVDVPGRTEWVTRVEADPFDTQAAYVSFSGYRSGSGMPHVFRTRDLGATWSDISADLPQVPVNCILADTDPLMEGRLYAGADVGVYLSDDWGDSWSPMDGGIPVVVVHDLDLVGSTRTLFAGTHGRSIWSFDLDQLPPPDADGDGVANALDCAPEDPGVFSPPGEVTGLTVASDQTTLVWNSQATSSGTATVYEVIRGEIPGLPVGTGPGETCLGTGLAGATVTDTAQPGPGKAYWYLARGVNSCGSGGYGVTSTGAQRVSIVCP